MKKSQYEVEVLIHGKPAKEYSQYIDGEYRTFLEGREGTEYSIRIHNHSNQKLLAIAAIDSINVVTGKPSDGYHGRGYIIGPYGRVTIKGYRVSDEEVGAFKFTNRHSSYAESKGLEHNSGIIAINLIAEKYIPTSNVSLLGTINNGGLIASAGLVDSNPSWHGTASYTCSTSDSTSLSNSTPTYGGQTKRAFMDLGSTWGSKVNDKINRAHFEKGDIVAQFKINYASRPALEAMGVYIHSSKTIDWPNGFENEYAKPPKGWS